MSLTREFLKSCIVTLPLVCAGPSVSEEAIPDSVSIQLGTTTFSPFGHENFCKIHPQECNVLSPDTTPLHLTQEIWNDMVRINDSVNKSIYPMTDMELYGREENWEYPVHAGDCEDFALQKRKLLLQKGLPHASLLLTVVNKRDNGAAHAVLTVRTDRGDYFLDNMRRFPYPVDKADYNIVKAQNPANSGRWVSVGGRFMAAPASAVKPTSTGAPAADPR